MPPSRAGDVRGRSSSVEGTIPSCAISPSAAAFSARYNVIASYLLCASFETCGAGDMPAGGEAETGVESLKKRFPVEYSLHVEQH